MKKTIIITYGLLFSAICSHAQVKTDRSLGGFTGLKTDGALQIKVSQGETNSLHVEAPDQETADHIVSEIRDSILYIHANGNLKGSSAIVLNLTAKNLKRIETEGAAAVLGQGPLKTSDLSIQCGGASSVNLETQASKVDVKLSGAGDIVLSGQAESLHADVSGAGNLRASKLDVKKADVKVSGAGDARINPSQNLHAEADGAGDVVYLHEPVEKSVEMSGAGSVRKAFGKDTLAGDHRNDTTWVVFGRRKICVLDNDQKEEHKHHHNHAYNHWAGVDLGVNGLLTYDNQLSMKPGNEFMDLDYGRSVTVGLNFFEKHIHLYQNHLNIVTGLGMEFDHFALKNNVSLVKEPSYTTATSDSVSYTKNKLNANYLTVPLMLEFNSGDRPRKSFHIAVGLLGGYRLWSKTKQEFTSNQGKEIYISHKDDYNLNPFRYSLVGRIGYGHLTLFASYSLSELFIPGKGPQVYPFTAGINIHL